MNTVAALDVRPAANSPWLIVRTMIAWLRYRL